mgnify:CR=1 FL=1
MGVFKRLHRITIGRISALLDRVEDPETVFPCLLKEMEDQLRLATEEEATATAAYKRAEAELGRSHERIKELGEGAANAVSAGDEATARAALAAQVEAEQTSDFSTKNLETLKSTMDLATAARKQIQSQLEELRTRKKELIARSRTAKAREKIQATVGGTSGSSDSILDTVARLEEHVEASELELDIQARLAGEVGVDPSLEKRLAELGSNAEVEKRLQALQEQAGGSDAGT